MIIEVEIKNITRAIYPTIQHFESKKIGETANSVYNYMKVNEQWLI